MIYSDMSDQMLASVLLRLSSTSQLFTFCAYAGPKSEENFFEWEALITYVPIKCCHYRFISEHNINESASLYIHYGPATSTSFVPSGNDTDYK